MLSAFQFAFHSRPDIGSWNKVATIRLGQPGSDSLLESSLLCEIAINRLAGKLIDGTPERAAIRASSAACSVVS